VAEEKRVIAKFTGPNGDAWQINLDYVAYVNWPAAEAGLDARDVVIHFAGVPTPLRLPMSPEQANDFERALRDHNSPDWSTQARPS
jgi:hypothetical protein